MPKPWTQEEDSFIIDSVATMNDAQIGKLLDRTRKAITHRRHKLGLENLRSPKSSMKKWSPEEDQFLIDNYGKMTYSEMVEFLPGRTTQAIEIRKKYVNDRLDNPRNRKSSGDQWLEEEDTFIIANYGKLTYAEMALNLKGRTLESIQSRVNVLGFERDIRQARGIKSRKYSVNEDFFSTPNIINSYYAGFIAADGNINESRNTVALRINTKDEYILDQLLCDCHYTGDVNYFMGNGKSEGNVYADLRVYCQPSWVQDLQKNFNIGPRKTLTLQPPNLRKEVNIISFIRGFIDGDGYITPNTDSNGTRWRIGACGTEAMMSYLKYWFDRWVPDTSRKQPAGVIGPYNTKVYKYQVSGKRALKIIQKLLTVKTPTYLTRKWDPVISYLQNDLISNHRLPVNP